MIENKINTLLISMFQHRYDIKNDIKHNENHISINTKKISMYERFNLTIKLNKINSAISVAFDEDNQELNIFNIKEV